jgi:hypothetical protein
MGDRRMALATAAGFYGVLLAIAIVTFHPSKQVRALAGSERY